MGKENPYFTQIPLADYGDESTVRDGVASEDDLALRALVPKWRPKRGRRPAEDGPIDSPAAKRQLRASSLTADEQLNSAVALSAYPQSAFPWDRQSNFSDPWSNASRHLASGSQQPPLQRQGQHHNPTQQQPPSSPPSQSQNQPVPSIEAQLPFYVGNNETGLPQSAIQDRPPSSAFPRSTPTPHSAHPSTTSASASTGRGRKRQNNVSAAWAPDARSGSKPRGRPPANRATQDGPFGTFPAKASGEGDATPLSAIPPSSAPRENGTAPATLGTAQQSPRAQHLQAQSQQHAAASPVAAGSSISDPKLSPYSSIANANTRKPSRLQLQVPQHEGGPIRLATPPTSDQQQHAPPRVIVQSAAATGRAANGSHQHYLHQRGSSAEYYVRHRGGGGEVGAAAEDGSELGAEMDAWDNDADDAPEDDAQGAVDWKRRALALSRKVKDLEAELRAVRRRVMEAVME